MNDEGLKEKKASRMLAALKVESQVAKATTRQRP
ncbi:hypothetical protein SAMN05444285_1487 [Draconibacterium orientale]|uniref:Uncharacterized protein n=1 Tax=Draconibacterium orientale TaxID=1168034 RepID=A0A1I0JMP9_9BACT|nr:hypothetical protein SAMN05444285_1487 [Draconibacterium orientale]